MRVGREDLKMSSLVTKMATKAAEKKMKEGLKDLTPKPPAGSGPRIRRKREQNTAS